MLLKSAERDLVACPGRFKCNLLSIIFENRSVHQDLKLSLIAMYIITNH